jgi:hypothetical protein
LNSSFFSSVSVPLYHSRSASRIRRGGDGVAAALDARGDQLHHLVGLTGRLTIQAFTMRSALAQVHHGDLGAHATSALFATVVGVGLDVQGHLAGLVGDAGEHLQARQVVEHVGVDVHAALVHRLGELGLFQNFSMTRRPCDISSG